LDQTEMICADLLAGANLDGGDLHALLHSMARLFQFLPGEQQKAFAQQVAEEVANAESGSTQAAAIASR
jgi:hypothetical protein